MHRQAGGTMLVIFEEAIKVNMIKILIETFINEIISTNASCQELIGTAD
jgi:hypothetical protein